MSKRVSLALALALTTLVTFGVVVMGARAGYFGGGDGESAVAPVDAAEQVTWEETVPAVDETVPEEAAPVITTEPQVVTEYVYVDEPAYYYTTQGMGDPAPQDTAASEAPSSTATPNASAAPTPLATSTPRPTTAATPMPTATPPPIVSQPVAPTPFVPVQPAITPAPVVATPEPTPPLVFAPTPPPPAGGGGYWDDDDGHDEHDDDHEDEHEGYDE